MNCERCGFDFTESEIQESHILPEYMGGTDADGREHLCKECHRKYEWRIILYTWNCIPKKIQEKIKEDIKDGGHT